MSESKAKLLRNAQALYHANQELQHELLTLIRVLYVLGKREENAGRELTVSEFEMDQVPDDGYVRVHRDPVGGLFIFKPGIHEAKHAPAMIVVEEEATKVPAEVFDAAIQRHREDVERAVHGNEQASEESEAPTE